MILLVLFFLIFWVLAPLLQSEAFYLPLHQEGATHRSNFCITLSSFSILFFPPLADQFIFSRFIDLTILLRSNWLLSVHHHLASHRGHLSWSPSCLDLIGLSIVPHRNTLIRSCSTINNNYKSYNIMIIMQLVLLHSLV